MITQQNLKQQKPKNPYLEQKVMSASPEQLIAYIYDAGTTACIKKDRDLAAKAVGALLSSLNFEYKETAGTFYSVYRYLRFLVMKGRFDEAREIFSDLRKTWVKAFKLM